MKKGRNFCWHVAIPNSAYLDQQVLVKLAPSRIAGLTRALILLRSLRLPPSWIQVETTTKCNLRCKTCLRTHTHPDLSNDMSLKVFKLIVNNSVGSILVKPTIKLIGLGEPLLNPHITSMVKYAKRKGLEVELLSNLTIADPRIWKELIDARLDSLAVSLDAGSPETFEEIRVGAKFEDVVSNIRQLIKTRDDMNSPKPRVFFRSTISNENAHEISAISKLPEKIGVDRAIFSDKISPSKENQGCMHLNTPNPKVSQIEASSWIKRSSHSCPATVRCYITYDGKVLPCNALMMLVSREEYAKIEFGNVTQDALLRIWFSKRYKKFRALKTLGFHPHFCRECPNISARAVLKEQGKPR